MSVTQRRFCRVICDAAARMRLMGALLALSPPKPEPKTAPVVVNPKQVATKPGERGEDEALRGWKHHVGVPSGQPDQMLHGASGNEREPEPRAKRACRALGISFQTPTHPSAFNLFRGQFNPKESEFVAGPAATHVQ